MLQTEKDSGISVGEEEAEPSEIPGTSEVRKNGTTS
jgi:hypothetical protein